MPRMKILTPAEQAEFDSPPGFSSAERKNPKNRRDKGKPAGLKYHWKHRVPRSAHCVAPRVNLTFRRIL